MIESKNTAFRNVTHYPERFIQINGDKILLPVTYKKSWDDGFGARGWKLDISIGDPQIIASTRETGPRINTSVFVHDILDHFLCGFGVSGHRSEAMALIQLSKRTGVSPEADYRQIIEEDLLNGRVNGESMQSFLPSSLMALLPEKEKIPDKKIILYLKGKLANKDLTDTLVKHFYALGKMGEKHAENSWKKLGLKHYKQKTMGEALQRLLIKIDTNVEAINIEEVKGVFTIDSVQVSFNVIDDSHVMSVGTCQENY